MVGQLFALQPSVSWNYQFWWFAFLSMEKMVLMWILSAFDNNNNTTIKNDILKPEM
jgi:hypothetical protein